MKFRLLLLCFGCFSCLLGQESSTKSPIQLQADPATQSASLPLETNGSQDDLKPFGYGLFTDIQTAEEFAQAGSLPGHYLLGPGDRLGIYWGEKTNEQVETVIGVDGKLFIPTVGIVNAQGLNLQTFRTILNKKLEKLYNNYDLEILLLQPKNIRIRVLGEVKAPGNKTMNALGTVLDALLLAQGPTNMGSLRNIKLYRADSIIHHVDLYDFILKPQKTVDILLQNGDQIFVPVLESKVTVQGQIRRPAIYELNQRENEPISEIIDLAGGVTDLGFPEKIELSRITSKGHRQLYYHNLANPDTGVFKKMQNLDRIHVFSLKDQIPQQSVSIYGQVKHPGDYTFEDNMYLSDLLLKSGNTTKSAYMLKAEVAKVDPKNSPKWIEVNLYDVLGENSSEHDVLLEPDDKVFIRQIPEWQVGPMVRVEGEVMFPGLYAISKDSTTLKMIIEKAGGLTKDAHIAEAQLIRPRTLEPEDKEFDRLELMTREQMSETEYEYYVMKQNSTTINTVVVDFFSLLIENDLNEDVKLQDKDIIRIPQKTEMIFVTGRIANPGGIIYKSGADFKYYIEKAGGYTWDADSKRTKIIKVTGEIVEKEDFKTFTPGDRIWIPRKKDRDLWQLFRDAVFTLSQIATIYLIIRTATE